MSTKDRLVFVAIVGLLAAIACFVPARSESFAIGLVCGYLVIRFFDLPRFLDRGGRGREGRRPATRTPRELAPKSELIDGVPATRFALDPARFIQ
jgi:hypothetical protein